jgi:hypothetical protein
MPSRRSILGRAPLLLGLVAGCLGGRGSEPTESATAPGRTAAGTTESPGAPNSPESPTSETSPESPSGAFSGESVQTLGAARVAVADPVVAPAVDVESRTTGAYTTSLAGQGRIRYAAPTASDRHEAGWVAFEVPSPLDVSEAAIRASVGGESAAWPLSAEAVRRLGTPAPTFELLSFEARRRDAGGVELSLAAENVGDVGGEFLAAVYWPTERIADDDESHIVRRSVDAGGRVEWSRPFETRYTGGPNGRVTARVDGVVTGSVTVDLPETATTES